MANKQVLHFAIIKYLVCCAGDQIAGYCITASALVRAGLDASMVVNDLGVPKQDASLRGRPRG